jgi:hypothetical protein
MTASPAPHATFCAPAKWAMATVMAEWSDQPIREVHSSSPAAVSANRRPTPTDQAQTSRGTVRYPMERPMSLYTLRKLVFGGGLVVHAVAHLGQTPHA